MPLVLSARKVVNQPVVVFFPVFSYHTPFLLIGNARLGGLRDGAPVPEYRSPD